MFSYFEPNFVEKFFSEKGFLHNRNKQYLDKLRVVKTPLDDCLLIVQTYKKLYIVIYG